MNDAFAEIGLHKTLKYIIGQFLTCIIANRLVLPPVRRCLLNMWCAHIGKDTVMEYCSLFNLYRTGLKGLRIGHHCFIGQECMLDLADGIHCGDHVSIGQRTVIITHLNVGFRSHPLQQAFPASSSPVRLESGCFVGANCTILPGVTIGEHSMVAAGSVVLEDVPARTLVAGVPAKHVRAITVPSTET